MHCQLRVRQHEIPALGPKIQIVAHRLTDQGGAGELLPLRCMYNSGGKCRAACENEHRNATQFSR
jgi:hypothetical protein